jgi:hypothetical protein
MNTFFIVVTFVMASATQLDRPLFVFAKPNFDEYMKCWNYVQANNMDIYRTAANEYNFKHKPEAIFCINQEAIKEIFNYNAPTIEKKNI